MFGKLLKGIGDAIDEVATATNRLLNTAEMGRVASVCAMMAYLPDGNADDDEIEAGVDVIGRRFGHVYKATEMVAEIRKRVNTLKESKRFGKIELMDELIPARGTDEAKFLVQVAAAVGEAPDDSLPRGTDPFTPAERALAAEIAVHLGLDPKTAGI